MLGSSSSLLTSVRRACLTSKSKIPPELADAGAQVGEQGFEGVEAFGFHELGRLQIRENRNYNAAKPPFPPFFGGF